MSKRSITFFTFILMLGLSQEALAVQNRPDQAPSVDSSSPSMGGSASHSGTNTNVSRSTDSRPNTSSPSRPSEGRSESSPQGIDTRSSKPSGRSSSGSSSSAGPSTSNSQSKSSSKSSSGRSSTASGKGLADSRSSRADDGDRQNRHTHRTKSSGKKSVPLGSNQSPTEQEVQDEQELETSTDEPESSEVIEKEGTLGQSKGFKSFAKRDDSDENKQENKKSVGPKRNKSLPLQSKVYVLDTTNDLDLIRDFLRRNGKRSALVYLVDKKMTLKVFSNKANVYHVKRTTRRIQFVVRRSGIKGYKSIRAKNLPLINAQATVFEFDDLADAENFFSYPGFGQFNSDNSFTPWSKHYIENESTGEIFEYDSQTGQSKSIRRSQIPEGRNIGGYYYEDGDTEGDLLW